VCAFALPQQPRCGTRLDPVVVSVQAPTSNTRALPRIVGAYRFAFFRGVARWRSQCAGGCQGRRRTRFTKPDQNQRTSHPWAIADLSRWYTLHSVCFSVGFQGFATAVADLPALCYFGASTHIYPGQSRPFNAVSVPSCVRQPQIDRVARGAFPSSPTCQYFPILHTTRLLPLSV